MSGKPEAARLLEALQLTPAEAADFLGLSLGFIYKTIRGDNPLPRPALLLLRVMHRHQITRQQVEASR